METTSDENSILLNLLALGFDYEECKKVLRVGIVDVEEAVERLLIAQQNNETNTNDIPENRNNEGERDQDVGTFRLDNSCEGNKTKDATTNLDENKVKSRYEPSEAQRISLDKYYEKERNEANIAYKKKRTDERSARKKILDQIEQDKKERSKHSVKDTLKDDLADESETPSTSSEGKEDHSGSLSVKSRYEPNESQRVSRDKYYEKERNEANIAYKKKRTEERSARKKILDQIEQDKKERSKQSAKDTSKEDLSATSDTPSTSSEAKEDQLCSLSLRLPNGTSRKLTVERSSTLNRILNNLRTEKILDDNGTFKMLQPFPRQIYTSNQMTKSLEELKLYPSVALIIQEVKNEEDHRSRQLNTEHNQSVESNIASEVSSSESLVTADFQTEVSNPSDPMDISFESDDSNNESDRSNKRYEALQKRMEALKQKEEDHKYNFVKRKIPTLQNACAKYIALLLVHLNTRIVNSMHHVSNKAACQIIKVLKEQKKFNATTLDLFLPCRLKDMQLDFYVLCTNDLLERLKWHNAIVKLSVNAAVCITDKSMKVALKGLPNLELLNVTECTKLTGSILSALKDTKKLKVLILDKVKIDNKSLNNYLMNEASNTLLHLSLNYCPINEDAFQQIPTKCAITTLQLSHTKITSLKFLSSCPKLSTLNLKNLPLENEQLIYLKSLEELQSLELAYTNISTEGLYSLTGLALTRLSLPNRLTVDDETIKAIKNLPLTSLDLSGFTKITNGATSYIAEIKSLVNLSLSNTKVNDQGILNIKELSNLEILDLSKCHVTSSIGPILETLKSLHTLNLSSTNIDDDIFKYLASCQNLCKLNLSRNSLTNESIGLLQLRYLSTLLLDQTDVTWEGTEKCIENCPNITMLRNSKYKILIQKT